ncbi:LPXTG cell wall anchor domain-containing protein [Lactobacillus mulieris]|uniref:LPXTG cell wall anchor domain-containing protein n=8 Tax=Lactobacillus mulieris TaxID=2508708 RepID=A0AAW5WZZ7_9LACO|nr:LPXTG cell wall anchor domain-containing protein [Lactobacillus mulieris]MCZ3702849.1 LPXTG cell wall anchor domain-containing protein [Lactobacillus mulieris]MCZ3704473.1 LPXTG cell wall anchor domain-containing protein [Lactobacillus mulieris]MCZ3706091.1 LPXTG cell wall anchor domain-containing protein [Lactobacillus mulieris]MCZ3707723.1 LPXTG cell wall anchor domain-containing protein [Lactobacillus mulieris]
MIQSEGKTTTYVALSQNSYSGNLSANKHNKDLSSKSESRKLPQTGNTEIGLRAVGLALLGLVAMAFIGKRKKE